MATTVHRCIMPAVKARAGNTSIVHPLVADDPELRADVNAPILPAAQHVVGHISHVAATKYGNAYQYRKISYEYEQNPNPGAPFNEDIHSASPVSLSRFQ